MVTRKQRTESHCDECIEPDGSGDAPGACSGEPSVNSLAENNISNDVKIKEEEEDFDKTIKVEVVSEEIIKTEEATVASGESTNNASVLASSDSTPDATNVQNPHPSTSNSNKTNALPKLKDDTPGPIKQERSDSLSSASNQDKPHTRSRTRSLSSAVSSTISSISGASGEGGERVSRGPAKKRHKARALFGKNNDTESAQDEKVNATATGRPRSNTIDSFRAAMDHQTNDLPTSSIVLPQIKQVTIDESNNTTASPPTARSRSDTIEFLHSSGFHTMMSHGSPSPRSRGDTIDFLNNSGDGIGLDPIPVIVASNSSSRKIQHDGKDIAHGKTPKKTNRTRASSQSSGSTSEGPLRKRHRTRSLQFMDQEKTDDKADSEDNDDTAIDSDDFRIRSNTFDYSMEDPLYSRSRSDTLDFLTAAVAGDMGHDLDAASAAAAGYGASFAMHPISAPSGASAMYHARRPRSNTIDSTASSLNSTKLDFLVSVAAEDNALLKSPEQRRERGDSSENIGRRPRSDTLEIFSNMASPRARGDTVDFLVGSNVDVSGLPALADSNENNTNVMDHLQALCDEPKLGPRGSGSKSTGILRKRRRSSSGNADVGNPPAAKAKFDEETERRARAQSVATLNTNFTLDTAAHRLLSESLNAMHSGKRHRLESWGGMSDISAGGMEHYSALRDTGLIDDIMAVANEIGEESVDGKRRSRANSGGSNSSGQPKGRPRFDSLASLSLASLSDASVSLSGPKEHKHVTTSGKISAKAGKDSASTAGNPSIVVDFAAIAAGVDAANAAIEGLDLTAIMGPKGTKPSTPSTNKAATDTRKYANAKPSLIASRTPQSISTTKAVVGPPPMYIKNAQLQPKVMPGKPHAQPPSAMPPKTMPPGSTPSSKAPVPFPVTSIKIPFVPIPKSTKTKEEMDAIMQRARAAAGYTPPTQGAPSVVKKAPPRKPPTTYTPYAKYGPGPICAANQRGAPPPYNPSMPPHHYSRTKTPPSYVKARTPSSTPKSSTLQSQQKWDDMFSYLVKFIEETRQEATKDMSEEKKKAWVWDGNVPTNYKTKCGKALGRWINNQRSAKSKGTLKDDREVRLVSTGLKWSVLTTNSWRDMLNELQIYVTEQTKDGRPWDGNVPTNYKIKSNTTSDGAEDEEKNLGRWINRQRSLFQAGKLKKERQLDLERIGLKWSVLLTTSWTTMYDGLCAFAEARRKQSADGVWDGEVPPNYKTNTNPPLSLGRWVNRQRAAQAKGQLKEDQVEKLEMLGLKWFEEGEGEEFINESTPMNVTSSSIIHQNDGNPLNGTSEPDNVTSTSEC